MPPPDRPLEQELENAWPQFVRELNPRALAEAYSYELLPLVLRRTSEETLPEEMRPIRLPELTNGPHLSYAVQWFTFATIAVIGSIVLYVRLGTGRNVASQE